MRCSKACRAAYREMVARAIAAIRLIILRRHSPRSDAARPSNPAPASSLGACCRPTLAPGPSPDSPAGDDGTHRRRHVRGGGCRWRITWVVGMLCSVPCGRPRSVGALTCPMGSWATVVEDDLLHALEIDEGRRRAECRLKHGTTARSRRPSPILSGQSRARLDSLTGGLTGGTTTTCTPSPAARRVADHSTIHFFVACQAAGGWRRRRRHALDRASCLPQNDCDGALSLPQSGESGSAHRAEQS